MGTRFSETLGCLLTCLITRAVFLELVPSLETDGLIMAQRQFVSREIRSDRGTNFVGAERELQDAIRGWNNSKIYQELQQKGIKWTFHPPTAAHMSGVWERLVQSAKKGAPEGYSGRYLDCSVSLRCELCSPKSNSL